MSYSALVVVFRADVTCMDADVSQELTSGTQHTSIRTIHNAYNAENTADNNDK